jgi:23S rRNA (guanosine2251-2'-O)-methyltransferase
MPSRARRSAAAGAFEGIVLDPRGGTISHHDRNTSEAPNKFGRFAVPPPLSYKPRMKKAKSRPRRPAPTEGRAPPPSRSGEPGAWLYGTHAVLAALANPRRRLHRLLATSNGAEHLPPNLKVNPQLVTARELEGHLPREAVHQGLALLAEPLPDRMLDEVCAPDGPALVIALDQVTDPHNVGAILRSAAAFGARALVLTERHSPAATGTLAKAASGGLEHVPLLRIVNLARGLDELKERGYWVVGLDEEAPYGLDELAPAERTVIVLGAEGTGLRRLTRERCDRLVRLPTKGPIGSLNVSNAAAVALYALAAGAKGR